MKPLKIFGIIIMIFLMFQTGTAAFAQKVPKDDSITVWIDTAMQEDPRINISDLKINTLDGIVTLSGSVSTLAEKEYAIREAKKIAGVQGVLDEITIKPVERSNWDIEQEIQRLVKADAYLANSAIEFQVNNGIVTLSGHAASYAEIREAELLAGEVRGVLSVVNEVTLKFEKQNDTDLKNMIMDKINRDVYLVDLPIKVDVKKGIATLTGSVGTLYQKERAASDAFNILGVADVNNELTVNVSEWQGVRYKQKFVSDDDLLKSVMNEIFQDRRIIPLGIAVDAHKGKVILSGSVPSYYEKLLAERDAKNVIGVVKVQNDLKVNEEPRTDISIKDDILFNITVLSNLKDQNIHVSVKNGLVTLTGTVDEIWQRELARSEAARVRGITEINNLIEVNGEPELTESSIVDKIKSRLASNWDTRFIADQISIKFKKGKVTLSGEVYSWLEREQAESIVLNTAGVKSVQNLLTVNVVNYPLDL